MIHMNVRQIFTTSSAVTALAGQGAQQKTTMAFFGPYVGTTQMVSMFLIEGCFFASQLFFDTKRNMDFFSDFCIWNPPVLNAILWAKILWGL